MCCRVPTRFRGVPVGFRVSVRLVYVGGCTSAFAVGRMSSWPCSSVGRWAGGCHVGPRGVLSVISVTRVGGLRVGGRGGTHRLFSGVGGVACLASFGVGGDWFVVSCLRCLGGGGGVFWGVRLGGLEEGVSGLGRSSIYGHVGVCLARCFLWGSGGVYGSP